jgi:hypothetical protein
MNVVCKLHIIGTSEPSDCKVSSFRKIKKISKNILEKEFSDNLSDFPIKLVFVLENGKKGPFKRGKNLCL